MITFRPTPALAKKLDLSLSATIPAIANRAADWCVQEFRAARRTYLLYCNDLMRIAQGHLEEGLAPAVASRRTATTPLGILGLKSPEAVFPRLRGVSR